MTRKNTDSHNKQEKQLRLTLDSLLEEVESIKGGFDLDKIFDLQGSALLELGISSIISFYDQKKKTLEVKNFSFPGNNLKEKSEIILPLDNCSGYKQAFKKKRAVFCKDCHGHLAEVCPQIKEVIKNKKLCNAIILPLVNRGEIIGFWELFSCDLKKESLDLLSSFAHEFVLRISNILLFQQTKKSEKKYRDLFEKAYEGFLVYDINKKVVIDVNKKFCRLTGCKKEALVNRDIFSLFQSKDSHKIDDLMQSVERLKTRKEAAPREIRISMVFGKNKLRHFRLKVIQIIDDNECFLAFRDITKEKEAFDSLQKTKKHFENVIDSIRDGICVVNKNFQIESYNKIFAEKTGYDFSGAKGKNCSEVLPRYENGLFRNHCARSVCSKTCGAESVFLTGKKVTFVEKNQGEDGVMQYHKINIYPAQSTKSEVTKAVMTIKDVTEKTHSEESIRRLSEFNKRILDNVPVSIMIIDANGIIKSVNDYFKNFSKHFEYVGRNIFKIPFYAEQGLLEKFEKLLKKGKSFSKENCVTVHWDGQIKYLNIVAVPLKDQRGKIEGAISMAIDNTVSILSKQRIEKMNEELEKKITERTWQLNKLNKELAKVLELKSKFISDVSHELRTPLTIIQGNLDLAASQSDHKTSNSSDLFKTIEKEVRHVANLLSSLTMISNADANQDKTGYEDVDIKELIKDATRSLDVLAKKKKIKLSYKIINHKKMVIKGDELKLERLLLNILRNAIKYTPEKGKIVISGERYPGEVKITVKDNGIGIPQGDLPYIFERFYRVDKARSREEGGTGLGLAICYIIAKAHSGSISVESQLGKGSSFKVALPLDYRKNSKKLAPQLFD